MSSIQLPKIYSASVKGHSHSVRNLPNQDSFNVQYDKNTGFWAAAIADGHGSSSHPRSDIGSELAVKCAVMKIFEFLKESSDEDKSLENVRDQLFNSIINAWRAEIRVSWNKRQDELYADWLEMDISPDELNKYGTTLAFIFPYKDVLILASIGDSDGFWRSKSGLARSLDVFGYGEDRIGEETYSLCLPNAINFFQLKTISLIDGGTLILTTDGIKKSLPSDAGLNSLLDYYHLQASQNNSEMINDLTEQLQTLTTKGSGDDCTAVVIHFPESKSDAFSEKLGTATNFADQQINLSPVLRDEFCIVEEAASRPGLSLDKKKIALLMTMILVVVIMILHYHQILRLNQLKGIIESSKMITERKIKCLKQ